MNLLDRYYSLTRLQLFISIVVASLILIWLSRTLLINEVVFYNAYSEQLTYERSLKLFEELKSLSWISYVFTPIILLIKFSIISLVIYIGIVLYNVQSKITLGSVFKIVMASEAIFVMAGIIKLCWFYFFAGNYDLNDLGFFYPLSLINFFNRSELSKIWVFPFQSINVFHILYILSISYGLNRICLIEKAASDKIVLLSYIPALVLWIVFIMFLTIDVSV
jgi:hypothetical protein